MQTSTPMGGGNPNMGTNNNNNDLSNKYEIFSNGPGNVLDKADSLYGGDMDLAQPQMQARGSLDMQQRSSLDMAPMFKHGNSMANDKNNSMVAQQNLFAQGSRLS